MSQYEFKMIGKRRHRSDLFIHFKDSHQRIWMEIKYFRLWPKWYFSQHKRAVKKGIDNLRKQVGLSRSDLGVFLYLVAAHIGPIKKRIRDHVSEVGRSFGISFEAQRYIADLSYFSYVADDQGTIRSW